MPRLQDLALPMYCSECGKPASGKFCCHCGTRIGDGSSLVAVDDPVDALLDWESVVDWESESRYDLLMRVPDVRERINRHASQAKKGVTGEQLLEIYDKIVPTGVPLAKLVTIIQPLYAKWGIGTGKQRIESIAAPIGRVMLRALCSMARHNQSIRQVKQGTDGCFFEATLPSDVWTLEGDLLITIERRGSRAEVSAATKIAGTFFDWGKSNRCLEQFFGDLQFDPA